MLRIFFFLIITIPAFSQPSGNAAMDRMEKKGKWTKVEHTLFKLLSKDSINPEARYLFSLYYFSTKNPLYNLDSAYVYSKQAWSDFQSSSLKDRERLKKDEIDSLSLNGLIQKIDITSFETSKRLNSENSYQHFIDLHKNAIQIAAAIELRDEVAFLNALQFNTWTSFLKYINKYPSSLRIKEAQIRYDRLLFEDKTRDHSLLSYIKFLEDFPLTPYKVQTEEAILELSTATGSPESFLWFIENYSAGYATTKAKNILYKMQSSDEEYFFDTSWRTDSLKSVERLNEFYLVPVIKSGKYGFMDEVGNEIIAPVFGAIYQDYRCGEIRDRLLITSSGLIARDGHLVWNGHVSESKDIGNGFLLITSDSSNLVIHESGFRIGLKVNSALTIANRFIALENNKKWSLFSLTGKQLLPFSYDEISFIDSLIILNRSGKKIVTTPSRIANVSEKLILSEEFVFDDIRRWGPQHYLVRNGLLEGVLDARLNFIIPLERQHLRRMSFGFIHGSNDKMLIKGISKLENIIYKNVTEQGGWLRLQSSENRYQLYDKALDRMVQGDSIWFQGQMAFVETGDSINAFMPTGQKISFSLNTLFQFLEYGDSSAWLILEEKKRKVVYDAVSGIRLFSIDIDQLEPIAKNIFLATRAGKKGLLSESGKILLPIEYDAIVHSDSVGFSILKDRKFGRYELKSKVFISPLYDRNIKSYDRQLKIAFKENGYGFIHLNGKSLGTFEWEEIKYWNDSIALVKKNSQWLLINIHTSKIQLDRIRNYVVVKDSPLEKIFIVRQDNAFGVISSIHGVVIPIQYSDVINLGSKDMPLYFTERNIKEAAISVVVYFDYQGKVIRKQAMESDEFDRISCNH